VLVAASGKRDESTEMLKAEGFSQIVVFSLDDRRFALYLAAVKRVVQVAEITPLPKAPEIVAGIINVQGKIVPVFDVRKRFRLPEREMRITDQFIIAETAVRTVALLVDETGVVIDCFQNATVSPDEILPAMEFVEGVAKLEDGLVLIHNLDTFLSLDEEKRLEGALSDEGKDI
jgi:purine-binding chemotaxis protein CheW